MPTTTRRRAFASAIASLVLLGAALISANPAAADDHGDEPCYEYFDLVEYRLLVTPAQEAIVGIVEWRWEHQNFHINGNFQWSASKPSGSWNQTDQWRWQNGLASQPAQPAVYAYEWYDERTPPAHPWEATGNVDVAAISEEVDCDPDPGGDVCDENPQAEECVVDGGDVCDENPEHPDCVVDGGDVCDEDPQAEECLDGGGNNEGGDNNDGGDNNEGGDNDDPQVGGIVVVNQTTTSTTQPETDEPVEEAPAVLELEETAGPDTDVASAGAVASGGTLPRTGASSVSMLLVALGMVSGGFSLTQFARRED